MTMMNGNNVTYEYVQPEAQYEGINLREKKIVDAQYIDTEVYSGNPYIEALPFPKLTTGEISIAYNSVPKLPAYDKFMEMPQFKQKMYLDQLSSIRIALPFHKDLEEKFYRTLTESYSMRRECRVAAVAEVDGEPYEIKTGLCADHPGEAVIGFSMLGVTGTGKSTAIGKTLDHIPQLIRHHFGKRTVIQIVYLVINCEGCRNFSALYQSIGRQIDTVLNNGNDYYELAVKREKTLGQKSMKIRELIRNFNIGCLILDEIQNIDLTSTNENSIEAILTINNDSHVGIGVLGTEEAFEAIFSRERVARRLSDYIGAGRYCESWNTCSKIDNSLFSACTLFETPIVPDDDVIRAFQEESGGVISYIVELFSEVVKGYFSKKSRPEINAEFVHKIASTKMKIIHDIKKRQKSFDAAEIKRNALVKAMNNYDYDPAKRQADDEFILDDRSANVLPAITEVPDQSIVKNPQKPTKRKKKTNAVNKTIDEMLKSIEERK